MYHGCAADRARRAKRVAQRNRAAQRVDARRIELQFVHYGNRLRGEGLVQFDPADVFEPKPSRLKRSRDGLFGPDAHDLGRHAAHCEADEARERREAEPLHRGFACQDECRAAIGGLRAVSSGDGALVCEHGS